MKKSNSLWLFAISVGLIIVAIAFTSIINSVRSKDSATDIRAKAGATNTLKFVGIVSSIDETNGTFQVSSLKFEDNPNLDLGLWTVTPPPGFNLGSLTIGKKVTITVNSKTVLVSSHTLVATAIKF